MERRLRIKFVFFIFLQISSICVYSANGFDGIVNKDSLKRVKHGEEAVLKIENEWVRDSVKNYEKALAKRIDKYLMLKTEDIHPPKTGISVHFFDSLT